MFKGRKIGPQILDSHKKQKNISVTYSCLPHPARSDILNIRSTQSMRRNHSKTYKIMFIHSFVNCISIIFTDFIKYLTLVH